MFGLAAAAGCAAGFPVVSMGAFVSVVSFAPARAGATDTTRSNELQRNRFNFCMIDLSPSRE
jgi:hypothetical protein